MGSTIWELLALEHDILPDGSIAKPNEWDASPLPLFNELENGLHPPRALFVDTEPSEID
jgi:tubulin alpha